MDNLTLKEELQILSAASLAGGDAPENLDNQRARRFVHSTILQGKSRKRTFFRSPITYCAFALAACALVALVVVNHDTSSPLEVMQQESIHAAADSVALAADSLKVDSPSSLELSVIDE